MAAFCFLLPPHTFGCPTACRPYAAAWFRTISVQSFLHESRRPGCFYWAKPCTFCGICVRRVFLIESVMTTGTKSVTVVDTISTTVTFYLLPFWRCFWKETGDISNISGHKQIVCPDLMRPWSEKTRLGKMTIVIRI